MNIATTLPKNIPGTYTAVGRKTFFVKQKGGLILGKPNVNYAFGRRFCHLCRLCRSRRFRRRNRVFCRLCRRNRRFCRRFR